MTETNLLTKKSVAQYLGVSVTTVDRERKAGRLPAVRVGNQIRFEPMSVREYVLRQVET